MPFRKYRFLDYELEQYQALNSPGWTYVLTVEVVTWWGLFTRVRKFTNTVAHHIDGAAHFESVLGKWNTELKKRKR